MFNPQAKLTQEKNAGSVDKDGQFQDHSQLYTKYAIYILHMQHSILLLFLMYVCAAETTSTEMPTGFELNLSDFETPTASRKKNTGS